MGSLPHLIEILELKGSIRQLNILEREFQTRLERESFYLVNTARSRGRRWPEKKGWVGQKQWGPTHTSGASSKVNPRPISASTSLFSLPLLQHPLASTCSRRRYLCDMRPQRVCPPWTGWSSFLGGLVSPGCTSLIRCFSPGVCQRGRSWKINTNQGGLLGSWNYLAGRSEQVRGYFGPAITARAQRRVHRSCSPATA